MSTVFYRWGAGRDESRVTFDGTHISVFDLKREIILGNRMGNGKDFDLGIFDNVTGEEIKDDAHLIARSSSLVARRMPASLGKSRGTAQNYIVGTQAADSIGNEHRIEASAKQALLDKANRGARGGIGGFGSLSRRFDGKGDEAIGNAQGIASGGAPVISTGNEEEDRRIAAFFEQSGDQWERTQEDMSMAPGRQQQFRNRAAAARPGGAGGSAPGASTGPGGSARGQGGQFDYSLPPDREPPHGYICYRCGQKGHWIQNCPINDDPAASDRKRFNRVTGIPRSFLKTVEAPNTGEGSSAGAMLTADGGFVMAMPDQRQWQKQQAIKRRTAADADDLPYPPELTCPLDRRLFAEAVKVPCCGTTYCEECITSQLVEHDFECPACESKVASLKRLKKDEYVRARVAEWKEENEREGAGEGDAEEGDAKIESAEGQQESEKTDGAEQQKIDGSEREGSAVQVKQEEGESSTSAGPGAPLGDIRPPTGPRALAGKTEREGSETTAVKEEEAQSESEEGAASPTKAAGPAGPDPTDPPAHDREDTTGSNRTGESGDIATEKSKAIAALDPAKMQEMLNPQVMQIYNTQIRKMLLNPAVTPEAKAILTAQSQLVQATVMQMQMAGMGPPRPGQGQANGAGGRMGMNGQQGQGAGGVQGMGMPDMMNMGMGMNMQQMQQMQQMEQMMMMNMGGMGNMGMMGNMGDMGQGAGGMGMNNGPGNGFQQQQGGNFGPGMRGGRGGFQRGGPAGFRGRGRGRGGMGMGMGGQGFGQQGPGQGGAMGVKRGMDEGFEGGPDGKMARVG